jgi:hypothetical protein
VEKIMKKNVSEKIIEENAKVIKTMTFHRFPNPKNPRKIGAKWYSEEVITIIATAQSMMTEKIINSHNEDPYNSVEELIGDLQLIGMRVLNQFNKKGGVTRITQYGIEDFFKGGRLVKDGAS